MEKESVLPFKVGDLVECRSYQAGFRGAWFPCKIIETCRRDGELAHALEFVDFPDENIKMNRVYQFPSGEKSKETKKQLMVRPKYPPIYHDNQIPDANTISEASVVVNGLWEIGDSVDWLTDGCYWSGTVTEVFPDKKVQVLLPPPPIGEGSSYEAFYKDLRPSLDWSPEMVWSVQGGESSCRFPRVIKPINGEELRLGSDAIVQGAAASSSDASFSSQISANSQPSLVNPEGEEQCSEMNSRLEMEDNAVENTFLQKMSQLHMQE